MGGAQLPAVPRIVLLAADSVVPVSLEGHLKIEGDVAPAGLQLRLKQYRGNSPQPASIKLDGSFSFNDLGIGVEYALSVSGLEPDMYIKEARFGPADLRYQLLQLTSAEMFPLDVVIGTKGGRIDGAVESVPKSGAIVAIIPTDRLRKDLYRSTTVDAQGRFTIRGIAPGEYKVFAWNNPPQRYAFFDSEFLRPVEEVGKTIKVSVDSAEKLQLTVISD